ncbi:peptidase S10 [Phycicoccus sp. CSK15P-2]|uniref:S10 family peptidase n=1 Tax=Phycicoccus sp. CSK15P-2 TaxID=2807627 RepID=UPI0019518C25|nr:peptidase S10 [Phycicoccus sp. CSK15P-2]MBM6403079.1 peptidase S10 [Phycicoccus sp. CSK15P-2]
MTDHPASDHPHRPSADHKDTETAPAPPTDDFVTTDHVLRLGRKRLAYTATTGRMVLREEVHEDGVFTGHQPKAEVFLTSYVVEPHADTERPVMFAFNGGPGSSSIWLHLGLLGPRRAVSGDVGALQTPPYGLADNLDTVLATTDLVFIDPVSTGYSRAVQGGKAKPFHGFTGDVESVAEVIRLWTTRNDRWLSPKFVAGESYGTVRAAAVAEHLQTRRGMYLNGVVLVSSVLDLGSIGLHEPEDRGYVGFLPTYAAIAHHHGLHGDRPFEDVLAEAEGYAERTYPWVLSRGDRLTADERAEAVSTVARLTGLSEEYVDLSDLRVEHLHFFVELLRRQRRVVGRLDGRFTGPAGNAVAERMDADPSMDAIVGPYVAAWHHYVRTELGYESDLPYEQLSMAAHEEWSYSEFEGRSVDVTGRLAQAMRANPDLKVHVAYGWHDGATPYFAARETFSRMGLPPELSANIEHRYYPAGHMMYVHDETRARQSADIAEFVRGASGG